MLSCSKTATYSLAYNIAMDSLARVKFMTDNIYAENGALNVKLVDVIEERYITARR